VISEALYSITLICVFLKALLKTLRKTPSRWTGRFRLASLTMTYFHTGTRTIIGAEAFHCPVRDGKEWYHFAMVVRLKLFVTQAPGLDNEFIELISFIDLTNLWAYDCAQDF
jgi:hypothetical protein